jgi:glucose/arabinose dehydrogenase
MRYRMMLFTLVWIGLWMTSVNQAQPAPTVALELLAEGFTAPIGMIVPPDDSGRLFIVDQIGAIYIITPEGEKLDTPFLDVRDRIVELSNSRNDPRGLLSLAFHPDYAENGRLFVFYTVPPLEDAPDRASHTDLLVELRVSEEDPNRVDLSTERVILRVDQETIEHAAGQLLFDSRDGLLYVTLGDDNRPAETSQDPEALMGSVLRINVDVVNDAGDPYSIPADNPFVGTDGLDEIYAYGLRHPWRLSFDQETETIFINDPAWTFRYQRVFTLQPGANYGWDSQAEPFCFAPDNADEPLKTCLTGPDGEVFTPPVVEYGPELGQIITGGHLYRGTAIPQLQGRYIFSEWGENRDREPKLFAATPVETGLWPIEQLKIETPLPFPDTRFWSMGQDAEGELYLMTMRGFRITGESGQVYRIDPSRIESQD